MRQVKCGPPLVDVAVFVWSLTANQADGVAGEGKIGAFGYSPSRCFLTGEGHQCLPTTLTTPVIQHKHRVRLELQQKIMEKLSNFFFTCIHIILYIHSSDQK